jgi:hypothetical protein
MQKQGEYILSLVLQDISVLKSRRVDLIEGRADWSEIDVNHGQLLALAKVRGRLEAMLGMEALALK